jgi:hypothetical protein
LCAKLKQYHLLLKPSSVAASKAVSISDRLKGKPAGTFIVKTGIKGGIHQTQAKF